MIPVLPRDQRKSTKYMLLVINPIFTRLYFSSVALIRHVYNTAVTMSQSTFKHNVNLALQKSFNPPGQCNYYVINCKLVNNNSTSSVCLRKSLFSSRAQEMHSLHSSTSYPVVASISRYLHKTFKLEKVQTQIFQGGRIWICQTA